MKIRCNGYSNRLWYSFHCNGGSTTASGDYSTAMGHIQLPLVIVPAMGDETTASDYGSLTIGSYNSVNSSVTTGGNANNYDTDNAAFVIGNGYIDNSDPFNSIHKVRCLCCLL